MVFVEANLTQKRTRLRCVFAYIQLTKQLLEGVTIVGNAG